MTCKFEGCEKLPLALSEHCWGHMCDKETYTAKLVEAVARGEDLTGYNLQKVNLKNAHLENAKLSKANLSQADLSGAHLFNAKLDTADLVGTNLSGCELTNCDLRGADLTKTSLANSRLWNAHLEGANLTECDLSDSDLWNANLYGVKLWHTTFTSAKFMTIRTFARHNRTAGNARICETGLLSAEESYRDLKKYFITNGMYNDASWAAFKEKTMERLIMKKNLDLNYFPSLLMASLCGYGERQSRIVFSSIFTILLYATLYSSLGAMKSSLDPGYTLRFGDYLYISTVTFTTVGYGDFVPRASLMCKSIAASEAFMGVFLTGLFIFTLGRKYSGR